MFLADLCKQSRHALIPFDRVVLARVRGSPAKVNIGIANRKIFRELRVRTEMASAHWVIGAFPRQSAVGITPIASDTSARAQNEYHHNHKALPSLHPTHRRHCSSLRSPVSREVMA
jgi:hypothetical protein